MRILRRRGSDLGVGVRLIIQIVIGDRYNIMCMYELYTSFSIGTRSGLKIPGLKRLTNSYVVYY